MIIELPNDYLTDRELEAIARANLTFAFGDLLAALATMDQRDHESFVERASCFVERAVELRTHGANTEVTS